MNVVMSTTQPALYLKLPVSSMLWEGLRLYTRKWVLGTEESMEEGSHHPIQSQYAWEGVNWMTFFYILIIILINNNNLTRLLTLAQSVSRCRWWEMRWRGRRRKKNWVQPPAPASPCIPTRVDTMCPRKFITRLGSRVFSCLFLEYHEKYLVVYF